MKNSLALGITFLFLICTVSGVNWGENDIYINFSYLIVPFPIPYFTKQVCDNKFIPYDYILFSKDKCLGGLKIIHAEYFNDTPKENFTFIEYKNNPSSKTLYFNNNVLLKNISFCYFDISNNCWINNNITISSFMSYTNLGRRFEIHIFSLQGTTESKNSRICPLTLNFGNRKQNITCVYTKDDVSKIEIFRLAPNKTGFIDCRRFASEGYKTLGNSIMIENEEFITLISYNRNLDNFYYYYDKNNINDTILRFCSNESHVDLSNLDGPHLYFFPKDLNKHDLFEQIIFLSDFRELSVKWDIVYNYNSTIIFNPSFFQTIYPVDITFESESGDIYNPIILYYHEGRLLNETFVNITKFRFNKNLEFKGKHFKNFEKFVFPFDVYQTDFLLDHFPIPKNSTSKIDSYHDSKIYSIDEIMFIEIFVNKTIKWASIIYIFYLLLLIINDIKDYRRSRKMNYSTKDFIADGFMLAGLLTSFEFISFPVILLFIHHLVQLTLLFKHNKNLLKYISRSKVYELGLFILSKLKLFVRKNK